ncbi:MAG TPA: hypothetical protein VJ745_07835 [Gaiellaceae bacterium]|nr:hypothetical protein [Gaiellaceae bacterium]
MSAHALGGLAVLNALFLASGIAVLWLVRGLETWADVARLAGLAYISGVVAIGSLWTLALIVGVPFSLGMVLGLPVAVFVGACVASRRRGRSWPKRAAEGSRRRLVVTAVGISASVLLLAGFFRGARLSGLYWWDAWSFWIPKAKAIYLFGNLDVGFFTDLPGSSYPPLVPVLDAAVFHAMGSADVVTLHVQYWLFGVGFVWALAGLLAARVPDWILWPFVLLLLVAPRIGERFLITEADLFLDYLFALACVLVVVWILGRERWHLVLATLLMCGMVLTKREGLLLAAALIAAALLASAPKWRATWPALALAATVAAAVAVPWRIWYVAHGVAGETPSGGLAPTADADRLWPSFRLAFDVLFSSEYWSVLVPVAIGALVLAGLVRSYVVVVFFGTVVLLVTLGGGWITWAVPELEITQELGANPIVRYMGAAALVCAAASPILLSTAWRAVAPRRE